MKQPVRTILLGAGLLLLLGVSVQAARSAVAGAQVAHGQTISFPKLANLGASRSLVIVPLYEEAAEGAAFQSGHGVSYLVKTDTMTLLVDVGHNPANTTPSPLEHNMQQMGVTLRDLDAIVITHHHPDHVGSLSWHSQGTFSLGSAQVDLAGVPVYVPKAMTYPAASPTLASQPQKLSDGVATLGVLPFMDVFPFSLVQPQAAEQTLAVNVAGRGIVLISGCGHAGLTAMVARAEMLFAAPVIGVVGGLHYEEKAAADLQGEIQFLRERRPQLVALSPHDDGLAARAAFQAAFPAAYQAIAVGREIRLDGR